MSTTTDFDKLSAEATKALVMRAAAILSDKMQDSENVTIKDALAVFDSGNKRLGMNQTEKTDNLPTIHWTINNGSVTMQMTPAAKTALEDVVEVETVEIMTPEKAFTMDFSNIEAVGNDL